ncbi:MAG: hypothetical protein H6837_16905 [Planctomycetes bacterium]|nr:hypothetical protein [Planctomycetota bacterium]
MSAVKLGMVCSGVGRLRTLAPSAWLTLCVVGAAPSVVAAQSSLVVPSQYADVEAPNGVFWAVSPFAARRQLLIDERHLLGLKGRSIARIVLRRNGGDPDALRSSAVWLELTMSHAPRAADATQAAFASNRGGDASVVFAGDVTLPATPGVAKPPASWAGAGAITIRLARPFTYRGGTLCLETVTGKALRATPNEPWWPIDAATQPQSARGAVTTLGVSCIPGCGPTPAGADAASFVPGATACMWLRGVLPANDYALCCLGASARSWGTIPLPMDLTPFGAAGCWVQVDLLVMSRVALRTLPRTGERLGMLEFELPAVPAIVGLSLFSQWAVETRRNAFGWVTSNGVRATVGALSPASGVSWVECADTNASVGRLLRDRCPVLRFEFDAP